MKNRKTDVKYKLQLRLEIAYGIISCPKETFTVDCFDYQILGDSGISAIPELTTKQTKTTNRK